MRRAYAHRLQTSWIVSPGRAKTSFEIAGVPFTEIAPRRTSACDAASVGAIPKKRVRCGTVKSTDCAKRDTRFMGPQNFVCLRRN